jgi:hypothetical protein
MIQGGAMTRATFTAAIAFLCCTAAGTEQLPVTVVSPCKCRDAQCEGRWAAKNDPATPPTDASAIQAVTPSDIYDWARIDVQLHWQSERTGMEKQQVRTHGPRGCNPYFET